MACQDMEDSVEVDSVVEVDSDAAAEWDGEDGEDGCLLRGLFLWDLTLQPNLNCSGLRQRF